MVGKLIYRNETNQKLTGVFEQKLTVLVQILTIVEIITNWQYK